MNEEIMHAEAAAAVYSTRIIIYYDVISGVRKTSKQALDSPTFPLKDGIICFS
jgi:hypothetical protein